MTGANRLSLDELVRAIVREELTQHADPDPLVRVCDALPLSRSRCNTIARSGAITGAALLGGRTWVARRSAIDAYVAAHAVTPKAPQEHGDDVDRDLAELGLGGAR